jgi:hypothetical protein
LPRCVFLQGQNGEVESCLQTSLVRHPSAGSILDGGNC